MAHETTIFRFNRAVSMADVETTLRLARLAASSLHGEDRVRMQAESRVDHARHACEIDTSSEPGQSLALIFGGYVRREFGDTAVNIERVRMPPASQPEEILT